jgi:DDE superfamily endonuclease
VLAFCDNSNEALAGLLRPGNAGSNTAADLIAVLDQALAQVPDEFRHGYPVLVRCDGAGASKALLAHYGTHKSPAIKTWLAAHPRFHMHHTPTYSSWINQVERWFAYLTEDLLRRGDHRSVQALEKDIRA